MNNLKIFANAFPLSLLLAACGSTLPADPAVQVVPTETSAAAVLPTDAADAASGAMPELATDLAWLIGKSREDAQGLVTVIVTAQNINSSADAIEFSVAMDTHSVDLSMDLALLATLTADTGLTVNGVTWDGPLGGHHVEGTLSFPASVNGASLLDGANMLTLTIRDVDAAERIFSWQR